MKNRFHSAETVKTMGAFRIGRKPTGPWTNMIPPIRRTPAGTEPDPLSEAIPSVSLQQASDASPTVVFRKTATAAGLDDRDGAPLSATTSHTASSVASDDVSTSHDSGYNSYDEVDADGRRLKISTISHKCPVKYTDWAIQQEIDLNLKDYPSLDPLVQQNITKRYRLLHQQVKDEGLYDCRYLQYGKEMIRYSIIFASFLFALRHEWYMTSAVLLGAFWVSSSWSRWLTRSWWKTVQLTGIVAPNYVHSTRRWPSSYYA